MVDQQLFTRTLTEFARTLVRHYEISEVLYELAERVTSVVGVVGAGVTLVDDGGRLRFAASSADAITPLEQLQEREQEGPCVDAFHSGIPVMVPDLAADGDRWGPFKAEAARIGVSASAGIPMHLDGDHLGALNLYDVAVRPWTEEDAATASVLAAMATVYLLNASELARAQRTAQQLEVALESRIIIEQAKGVVATQRKVSIDQAFALLRQHARSRNAPLRTVAEAVVNLGLRL